jgi:hypothetical protein
MLETRERPPPILKMLMVGPLGGDAGDPGAPKTYPQDINGGGPRSRYWTPVSAHHLS